MGVYEAQKEFISIYWEKVIIYVCSDWQFEVGMYLVNPESMEAVIFYCWDLQDPLKLQCWISQKS